MEVAWCFERNHYLLITRQQWLFYWFTHYKNWVHYGQHIPSHHIYFYIL